MIKKERAKWLKRVKYPPGCWKPIIFLSFSMIKRNTEKEYIQWAWEWESNIARTKQLRRGMFDREDEKWITKEIEWVHYTDVMQRAAMNLDNTVRELKRRLE